MKMRVIDQYSAQLNLKTALLAAALKTALKNAGDTVLKETRLNVASGMSRSLGWPPWAPRTVERAGGYKEGLIDTGELLNSLNMEHDDKQAVIYTDTPYARFHEFGTNRTPMRPFMRPAILGNYKEVVARFRDDMKKAV